MNPNDPHEAFMQKARAKHHDFEHALNLYLTDAQLSELAAEIEKVEEVLVCDTLFSGSNQLYHPPRPSADRSNPRKEIERLRQALRSLSDCSKTLLNDALLEAFGGIPEASKDGLEFISNIKNRMDKRTRKRMDAMHPLEAFGNHAPNLIIGALSDACSIATGESPNAKVKAVAQKRLDEIAPTRGRGRPADKSKINTIKIILRFAETYERWTGRKPTATMYDVSTSRGGLFTEFVTVCIESIGRGQDPDSYTRRIRAALLQRKQLTE